MNDETKIICTHDGSFHLDEVTACALLKYGYFGSIGIKTQIIRSRKESDLESAHILVDVGRKFILMKFHKRKKLKNHVGV